MKGKKKKKKYGPDVVKKGDLYRVKILTKRGVVKHQWMTEKTLKKREVVFFRHKHRNISAFVPRLKVGKAPSPSLKPGLTHRPIKITLHIKVTYDKKHVNRYLARSREFHLEGSISTECYDNQRDKTVKHLERVLRERMNDHFCRADPKQTLLSSPYYSLDDDYESGIEIEKLDEETTPSKSIDANAEYRYSKDNTYKQMTL